MASLTSDEYRACVVCGKLFKRDGKRIVCSGECGKLRHNKCALEYQIRKMTTATGRSKILDARARYAYKTEQPTYKDLAITIIELVQNSNNPEEELLGFLLDNVRIRYKRQD